MSLSRLTSIFDSTDFKENGYIVSECKPAFFIRKSASSGSLFWKKQTGLNVNSPDIHGKEKI